MRDYVAAVCVLSLLAVASIGLARAQQQPSIPRLCFLTFDPGTLQTRSPRFDGFFQGLGHLVSIATGGDYFMPRG
jgi:putative ABC transport system substrate-binding protein